MIKFLFSKNISASTGTDVFIVDAVLRHTGWFSERIERLADCKETALTISQIGEFGKLTCRYHPRTEYFKKYKLESLFEKARE